MNNKNHCCYYCFDFIVVNDFQNRNHLSYFIIIQIILIISDESKPKNEKILFIYQQLIITLYSLLFCVSKQRPCC